MDKKYLIDTNIIIYFLDGKIPENQKNKLNEIFKNSFNISTITKIEVLGWCKRTYPLLARLDSMTINQQT